MNLVSSMRHRHSPVLEAGLLACCVVLGSLVTVAVFGNEVVDAYSGAAGLIPGTKEAQQAESPGFSPDNSAPLERKAVAVQGALFGIEISDVLDDERTR